MGKSIYSREQRAKLPCLHGHLATAGLLRKADEGMEKDAEETCKIAKEQREEMIQKRRDEREKLEKEIEENRNADTNTDSVKISEEGKELLRDIKDDTIDPESTELNEIKADNAKEPVTYVKQENLFQ